MIKHREHAVEDFLLSKSLSLPFEFIGLIETLKLKKRTYKIILLIILTVLLSIFDMGVVEISHNQRTAKVEYI